MKKGLFWLLTLSMVSSLILVGWSEDVAASQATAPSTIKIGALISLTGYDAWAGEPLKRGYEMAVEKINKEGGVYVKEYDKKIPLELVVLDAESKVEKAISRAEAFNSRGVSVACGTLTISGTSDIYEKNKLPAIVALASTGRLWERGFKYWFGIGTMNADKIEAIYRAFSDLPKDQRPSKWALWQEQTDWIVELFNIARKKAPAAGITYVFDEKYTMLSHDMSPLIFGAKKAGADVVLSVPTVPDTITMLKQMKELDYKPKAIIMIRGTDNPDWVNAAGSFSENVMGTTDWPRGLKYPGIKELNAEYQARYGTEVHICTGPAYTQIQVAADAIARAGTLDREKIRDAIAGTDLMTVWGRIKFNEKGQRIDPPKTVTQCQNGIMEIVSPDEMKTKPMVYPMPW
jgi:branched-chain amino acid transport system substrate-binding protein